MLFSRRILVRLIGEVLMTLTKCVLTSPLSSVQQYLLVLGKVMVVNTKSDQQRAEDDLYTVLRFKEKGDFERRIRELLVNDYKKLKKPLSKLLGKLESKIRTDKENNQAARNVYDQIKKSKTNEDKLSNLLNFKKQLKAFLKNQDDCSIVLNAIDSASVIPVIEVNGVHPKDSEIKKLKKAQPLTSNRQDFEEALGYIESQEKVMGITLEEIMEYKQHSVKIFLLNRVHSCKNGHSQLHPDVKEAIAILSNDKLRAFYDEEVKKKTLQPILSYKECEQLYDKINYEKNESHIIIEREELGENVRRVMGVKRFTNQSSREDQKNGISPTGTSTNYRQEQVASSGDRTLYNSDIPSLGRSIKSSRSALFMPFGASVDTSTTIKPANPSNLVTTGENYTSNADLSDELNVSEVTKIVERKELLSNSLKKIQEIVEKLGNTTLSEEVIVHERHFKKFMDFVGEILVDIGTRLPQSGSKSMYLERKLNGLEKMNESLDNSVQELEKKVDKLEKENKDFLAENDELKEKLATAKEEKELLFNKKEKMQEVINGLNEDNQRLMQKINGLEDDYKYLLRAEKTKRETEDSCIQVEDADIPEGKAELCKDYEIKLVKLEQEIDAKGKQCEELLLENSILRGNIERLKEENKRLEGIEESFSIDLSHFCSVKNLHDELILANEQPENIDISIQDEMDSKVATESVGVNVKQGYSKRTSNLSRVSEQSSAVKSQFSEARAQSRKQIIYASASLILSGVFAVGTSLTMSHLGISISLALTALTFLTLGCYCSYKASTTLRNIELDRTFKMADHEAVFMVPSL
ncbi:MULTISPECIES: TomO hydrophobic C-terminal domain-containing protein [Wolbachia]|uniref:TomO hydrophobic C-terminal domain-containing protein n=1 Tax=Wolbachia TaxID=953 RepID=UPI0003B2C0E4|nr:MULTISPECIES: hypothetical protein [Wolbachia]ERN55635.1 hypothetical protein WMELPOP_03518 [Wolbachia pipientis wMelPop]MCE4149279.1 hypothetical protein [Wolbachia endosymbiont of Drosophila melanogaster]MCE4150423.1 hypothetical protein [Wolbachia endosymbiont of Drosophila melanogaster]QED00018.1 hypothetical protein FRT63_03060 [Wolbachia pipientis]QED01144.1 hypothetical protein FRT61_03065 [Wolbachia pipientis]